MDSPEPSNLNLRLSGEITNMLFEAFRTGSEIQTQSSYAMQPRSSLPAPMVQIGSGDQGTVFEQAGRATVLKKEHPGNSEHHNNLKHEFAMHTRAWEAFTKFGSVSRCEAKVPRAVRLIESCDVGAGDMELFPQRFRARGNMMEMSRVLPMPRMIREAMLIHFYAAAAGVGDSQRNREIFEKSKKLALENPANKHCLVRILLGSESSREAARARAYREKCSNVSSCSLRNFPVFLSDLEHIGLNAWRLADSIGAAHAIMHWGACIDGTGVKYVLGTRTIAAYGDWQNRRVGLHLVDFGRCEAVDLSRDPASVYGVLKGAMVMGNAHLNIPCPRESPVVFSHFRVGYARAARLILRDKMLSHVFDIDAFLREYEAYAKHVLYGAWQ